MKQKTRFFALFRPVLSQEILRLCLRMTEGERTAEGEGQTDANLLRVCPEHSEGSEKTKHLPFEFSVQAFLQPNMTYSSVQMACGHLILSTELPTTLNR